MPSAAHADDTFRTVLVIDASSSMRRTDPTNLRKVAAELFVDLARDGDQIAVTGFDENARQSTGAFITIDGLPARDKLKAAIRAIGNDGKWTDFTAGLSEARRLLDTAANKPGDQELVIFLTDGRCEPDPAGPFAARLAARPNKKASSKEARTTACLEAVQNDIVPAFGKARLYAIGLSKAAPKAFLEEFGRRTGGLGVVTNNPAELPNLFAGVYARLLGSRLQKGTTKGESSFKVYDGAETLDVVVVGRSTKTGKLTDPSGREVPLHNQNPNQYYFVGAKEYRFYKITKPAVGTWKLSVEGGKKRSFATLQHFDLRLALMTKTPVAEHKQSIELSARLASPEGAIPPMEFLDRHIMRLAIGYGGNPIDEKLYEMKRAADGTFSGRFPMRTMGVAEIRLVLEPGPDGVLSRETTVLHKIQVIPPIKLVAQSINLGDVKQGSNASATLSLTGSTVGAALTISLELGGGDVSVSPTTLSLAVDESTVPGPEQRETVLEFLVGKKASSGTQTFPLKLSPTSPSGFEDRAIEVTVAVNVIALSFWEKHGTRVIVASGALVFLILLAGFLSPAKFKKRTLVYYMDTRDEDLERQSSYPLGAKAKRGFYRPARIELGNSGPVKQSGIVKLEATKGGRIVAIPRKGAVVLRAPGEDDSQFTDDEDRPAIPLKDGGFRMSSGTRYEIKGTGLVFWYK